MVRTTLLRGSGDSRFATGADLHVEPSGRGARGSHPIAPHEVPPRVGNDFSVGRMIHGLNTPDTNVLVSAIVFGGLPGRLVELAAEGHIQLILSPPLIEELREVLRRKFGFSDAAAYQAEALLRRISIVVEPQREVAIISEDPEDNRVLEAARAGDADVIVSGDRHLLSLERFGTTAILNPRELLNRIERSW